VLRAAGAATGRYLLTHRIPRPVRLALRAAPAPLAARLLVAAIRRHAWTFGMPDGLDASWRGGLRLILAANPIAVPGPAGAGCDFHAGTFEVLFQALVAHRLVVREIACRGAGHPACVFTIERGRSLTGIGPM
jgi:divinyl protochlorophyllide a 8-vinyl-reductase